MSNLGLEKAFKDLHIPFMRTHVGDRYVMDALVQTGWQLGGEGSGHIICLDKATTGDGIVCALQVLSAICQSGKTLHELKKGMTKCAQVLVNVPVKNGAQVVKDAHVLSKVEELEKSLQDKVRILLRSSGTEPVVRVMVEGEDKDLVDETAQKIAQEVANAAAKVT